MSLENSQLIRYLFKYIEVKELVLYSSADGEALAMVSFLPRSSPLLLCV